MITKQYGCTLLPLLFAAALLTAQPTVPDVGPARQQGPPAAPVELPKSLQSPMDAPPLVALPEPASSEFPDASAPTNRIGFHRTVPASALKAGRWEVTAGGVQIWRLALRSPGARSLRLHLQSFDAGQGKLFLFAGSDSTGSSVIGPYTGRGPQGSTEFWTGIVFADTVVLEYQPGSAAPAPGVPAFVIDKLSHVFRFQPGPVPTALTPLGAVSESWLSPPAAAGLSPVPEAAAFCQPDVACYSAYNTAKAGTLLLQYEEPGGTSLCSGAYLNTRSSVGTPYLLTAYHCISTQASAATVAGYWNYWSSYCNGPAPGLPLPQVLGSTLISARSGNPNYTLLRMTSVPTNAWRLGWTTSDAYVAGTQVSTVHYPQADYARLAFANITSQDANNHYWRYTQGFTEPGSSGAPWMRDAGTVAGTHNNGNSSSYANPCSALTSGLLSGSGSRFSAIYPYIQTYLEDATTCGYSLSATTYSAAAAGASNSFQVVTTAGCPWSAVSNAPSWITINPSSGSGSGTISFTVQANPTTASRTGTITVTGGGLTLTFTITQQPGPYGCAVNAISFNQTVSGMLTSAGCRSLFSSNRYAARYVFNGTAGQQVSILLTSITLDTFLYLIGPAGNIVAQDDDSAGNLNSRIPPSGWLTLPSTGQYTIEATTLGLFESGDYTLQLSSPGGSGSGPFAFIPITPCRLVDTRFGQGTSGAFGPPGMPGGSSRDFPVPTGRCGLPPSAAAYSLNVTVVPSGPLAYLTLWPTGQNRPTVSTLNAFDGQVTANAAIVPAGFGGSISAFVTNYTDVIIDVNGYFTSFGPPEALAFYPMTPCRVVDTRTPIPYFGTPPVFGNTSRDFPMPLSSCGIPSSARAYSLNATVVPQGPLGYLTLWPSGFARPTVSTLNAFDGGVTANAAIVPAGNGGSISAFASNTTDLILDINGYFAPPGTGLSFYTLNPCRVVDTRVGQGTSGAFGPPSLGGGTTRSFPVPSSPCGVPATARAYSFNATVVPFGALGYLTVWPWGQSQPLVSTLNAFDGQVTANAAIVPAGTSGAIGAFVTNPTDLILDINGYFAP